MTTIDGLISRVSLRLQIGLLAAVGIAAVVVLAAFFLYSEHLAEQSLDQANLATEVYEDVAAFDRALLLAKRADKNFIMSGRSADVTHHASAMSEAFAALSKLQTMSKTATDPRLAQVAAQFNEFLTAAKAYAADFADLVTMTNEYGTNEDSGLQGKMRRSAHDAEAMLAKLDLPRLHAAELTLRRYEKDIILRATGNYRDAFEQGFGSFTAALRAADLEPSVATALTASMTAYRADFLKLAAAKLNLAEEIKKYWYPMRRLNRR